MEVLFFNYDYEPFLDWLYGTHAPGLAAEPYEVQRRARAESLFGVSYHYPECFESYGHEARGFYVNNEHLQKAWAREHGYLDDADLDDAAADEGDGGEGRGGGGGLLDGLRAAASGTVLSRAEPLVGRLLGDRFVKPSWMYDVVEAQIRHYEPDVVVNQAVNYVSAAFLDGLRDRYGVLAGQSQSPLSDLRRVDRYDLVFSALPQFVERFERAGTDAVYLPLGFAESVLDAVETAGDAHAVTFVGSLSSAHEERVRTLTRLCEDIPVEVWGPGVDHLPASSPLRDAYRGPAWGKEMYEVLAASKVTLNSHIDVAGPYAANLRLFEATGIGTCLVTDRKRNLDDFFVPGEEVVAYGDPSEAAERVRALLDDDDRRESIAQAGHERTLTDHTYRRRLRRMETALRDRLDEV